MLINTKRLSFTLRVSVDCRIFDYLVEQRPPEPYGFPLSDMADVSDVYSITFFILRSRTEDLC